MPADNESESDANKAAINQQKILYTVICVKKASIETETKTHSRPLNKSKVEFPKPTI